MRADGTYTGRVVHSGDIETVGAKGFRKRVFAVTDDAPQYPQVIPFEQAGRSLDQPGPAVGDTVEVQYQLRGREYSGRFYPSLYCMGFRSLRQAEEPPAQPAWRSDGGAVAEGGGDAESLPF